MRGRKRKLTLEQEAKALELYQNSKVIGKQEYEQMELKW